MFCILSSYVTNVFASSYIKHHLSDVWWITGVNHYKHYIKYPCCCVDGIKIHLICHPNRSASALDQFHEITMISLFNRIVNNTWDTQKQQVYKHVHIHNKWSDDKLTSYEVCDSLRGSLFKLTYIYSSVKMTFLKHSVFYVFLVLLHFLCGLFIGEVL